MKVKGKQERRTGICRKDIRVLTGPSSKGMNQKDHYFTFAEI
jgi:hypothetical protein